MYQHQHVPLPLDLLEDVPRPVVVLLEVLLEKGPTRRFRSHNRAVLSKLPVTSQRLSALKAISSLLRRSGSCAESFGT